MGIEFMSPETKYEKHKKINSLPPAIKKPMIEMLAAGHEIRAVVKWLQNAGYMANVQSESVARAIGRWMSDEDNADLFKAVPAQISDDAEDEAVDEFSGPVNELEELKRLIGHQWARINKAGLAESDTKTLLPGISDEIKLLGQLLVQSAGVKLKMGIYQKEDGLPQLPSGVPDDVIDAEDLLDTAFGKAGPHEVIEGGGQLEDGESGTDSGGEDLRDTLDYKRRIRQDLLDKVGKGAVRGRDEGS